MLAQHRIDMQGNIFCEQRHIVTKYGFLEVPFIRFRISKSMCSGGRIGIPDWHAPDKHCQHDCQ